jgi:hypothetical protein
MQWLEDVDDLHTELRQLLWDLSKPHAPDLPSNRADEAQRRLSSMTTADVSALIDRLECLRRQLQQEGRNQR